MNNRLINLADLINDLTDTEEDLIDIYDDFLEKDHADLKEVNQ